MKVYEFNQFGLDQLALAERPDPVPGARDVVVSVRAASLNYRDVMMVQGQYNPRQKLPLIPLSDGVGEVIATGDDVTRVQVGDRVVGTFAQGWISRPVPRRTGGMKSTLGGPFDGMLAEQVKLSEEGVSKVPDYLTDVEAATLPCAALTAWSALVSQGTILSGETLLVQGTGGVSIFALQIARMIGVRVIVTSSSDEKLEHARALGANGMINYRTSEAWWKEAKKLTDGVGPDQIIEVGGAQTLQGSLRAVRPGGLISIIGVLTGGQGEVSVIPVLMNNLRLQGVSVGCRDELETMCRAFAANELHPVIDRIFAFEEAKEAFVYLTEGKHFGKVCISFN